MMEWQETKADKAISWLVIIGFCVMMYNLFGVCAEEVREILRHVF